VNEPLAAVRGGSEGRPPGPPGQAGVIAIDGGNSKTDLVLVAADGTLLSRVRGRGASAHSLGMEESLRILGELVAAAARDGGIRASPAGAAAGPPLAMHTCAFLAGADLQEEEDRLAEALRRQGWSTTTHVGNDTFAVLRAGTARGWGVAVTCGAGINCVGVAPDGRTTRFLALGRITGDWGGGLGIGVELMWWAMRAEDGRGPQTALRGAVAAHFGVPAVHDVAVKHHFGEITDDDLARLAPVLFEVAAAGDAIARRIVAQQAEEVVLMAVAAMRRLELLETGTDVVLGGGVLAARDPLLVHEIEVRLRQYAPNAVPCFASLPPVAGAALLGLEHIHAGPAAAARLRAAFAGASVPADTA
jgi:N-acetylglucosamine kinase-like BadF-type ATPase